ncbi:MAG: ATP-binding cassette domain-containing protein [Treponema sp.]|nr:ATP-binding cassette domain-containing protein [Treponema sp.]
MIKYLKVDNYCSLVNFKIDFSSINLLLGGNGTGKSTLFSLLANLRLFIQGKYDVANIFSFNSLTRWQSVPVQSFEFSISHKDSEYLYQLEIEFNRDEKKNRVKKEIVLCNGNPIFKAEKGKARLYNDSYEEGPEVLVNWSSSGVSAVYERSDNKKLCDFKQAVDNIIVCHPLPLEYDYAVSYTEEQYVNYYADNISNVYMHVVQKNPEKMIKLWEALKEINPCFVRTYLDGDSGKNLCFEYNQNGVKVSYTLTELSDGEFMLFTLYFLVAMYFDDDCSLFLDEPDNYISLQEVGQFIQYVQDMSNEKNQCVLISHHPSVIDYLAPSNGIWLARRSYGASVIVEPPKSDCGLTYSEVIAHGGADEAE